MFHVELTVPFIDSLCRRQVSAELFHVEQSIAYPDSHRNNPISLVPFEQNNIRVFHVEHLSNFVNSYADSLYNIHLTDSFYLVVPIITVHYYYFAIHKMLTIRIYFVHQKIVPRETDNVSLLRRLLRRQSP